MANGRSEIENYSPAADCAATLACLERLGVGIQRTRDGTPNVSVTGAGLSGWRKPGRLLNAENSGTTLRLLTGLLAGQPFDSAITGDASLRKRPMRRVIEPLTLMGAHIQAREGNYAPLEIHAAKLRSVEYKLPVASAQVKSAILLAGLLAEGETTVEECIKTRDHTELALHEFGARVRCIGPKISVQGRPVLQGRRLRVPGDLSSAVFFIAAAMVLPGSELLIYQTGLNPTRAAILDVFMEWGAPLRIASLRSQAGELVGDISVRHGQLSGGALSGARIAQLIDELPMLAALGPYTEHGVEIRDAAELRVKESDRIAALAENLRRMGAQVEERPDGLRVAGRASSTLKGAEVDPHGDHRIAMALAVAALGAGGTSRIKDSGCVAVSYPGFFAVMEKLITR